MRDGWFKLFWEISHTVMELTVVKLALKLLIQLRVQLESMALAMQDSSLKEDSLKRMALSDIKLGWIN